MIYSADLLISEHAKYLHILHTFYEQKNALLETAHLTIILTSKTSESKQLKIQKQKILYHSGVTILYHFTFIHTPEHLVFDF